MKIFGFFSFYCIFLLFVESTDDVNIVSYKWELTKGPLNDNNVFDSTSDTKILQLKNLLAGIYVFRLVFSEIYS